MIHTFFQESNSSSGQFVCKENLIRIWELIKKTKIEQIISATSLCYYGHMKTLEYSYAGFLPGILFRNNEPMVLKGKGQPLFPSFKSELDTF